MEFHKPRAAKLDYLLMAVGTALMAVSINSIYDPISMVTGGFTGAAIIIKELTAGIIPGGIPLWLTNIVLNIPVFILCLKIKGVRFLKRTLFATMALSFWLWILPVIPLGIDDFVLASLFGGAIGGIGIGLVLMGRATTGGTDLVAALIQHFMKQYSIVKIMQVVDGLIVVLGAYVFGITRAMYAIIAIFVTSWISDYLLEGVNFAKVAFIITEKKDEVAAEILKTTERGITSMDAQGMYSGQHKNLLFCVVSKKEIVDLKEAVACIDPSAFVVVSDAREVLGEGFQECKTP